MSKSLHVFIGLACTVAATFVLAWLGRHQIDSVFGRAMNLLRPVSQQNEGTHAVPVSLHREIAGANEQVEAEAHAIAAVTVRIAEVHQYVQEKREQQQHDAILLEGLHERLVATSDRNTVMIGDKSWLRQDLEHDAQLIMNRYRQRQEHIELLAGHRHDLTNRREAWRDLFRGNRNRLDKLNLKLELAHILAESLALTQKLRPEHWRQSDQLLNVAGRHASDAVKELQTGMIQGQLELELQYTSREPAADAIRLQSNLDARLPNQIEKLLEEHSQKLGGRSTQ